MSLLRGWGVVAVAALWLLAAGCERQAPEPLAVEASEWHAYIDRHSAGGVSAVQPLRVRFNTAMVEPAQVNRPLEAGVALSPQVPFEAMFTRVDELSITPRRALQPGQEYEVTLNPALAPGIEVGGDFRFRVVVLQQAMDLRLHGLVPSGEPGRMRLRGQLITGDAAPEAGVARVITATQEGRSLPVSWEHAPDRRYHEFTVADIERGAQASRVLIRWDGSAVGAEQQGERELAVPGSEEFAVTGVRVATEGSRHIVVTFSESLDARQNLSGLVRINGAHVRTQVDGGTLRVYPRSQVVGAVTLRLEGGVRSAAGARLGEAFERELVLMSLRPGVRFVGKGVILPEAEHLTVPFEAVNVSSVTVTGLQIYRDNIGQFLQNNTLDGERGLRNVGRYVWRKEIPLSSLPRDEWQRYLLDVSELVGEQPGALWRLSLSIERSQALFDCGDEHIAEPRPAAAPLPNWEGPGEVAASGWDGIEQWYSASGYVTYSDRQNPCKDAYYEFAQEARSERNFLASNLGLLAKQGSDDTLHVVVSDLRRSTVVSGAEVDVFNYQQQRIGRGVTDEHGMLSVALEGVPFYLAARAGDERGYLKLARGLALPTSQFDVGGEKVRDAIKGFIYGERDVWRPGDEIHLTFVLEDRDGRLPQGHPVSLELYDPRGNRTVSRTNSQPVGDFYTFTLRTEEHAPTGRWRAVARVGDRVFDTPIRIETVVPNRLRVELELEDEALRVDRPATATRLFAEWLSGASAAGLKADVQVRLASRATRFSRFQNFQFDDPAREFQGEPQTVFEGKLDAEGKARFPAQLMPGNPSPGMLRATFTSRVFEEGGNFSTQSQAFDYHPYPTYVGLRLPPGDESRNMLLTDTDHTVRIATLDNQGEPVARDNLEVALYKISWRWWWDKSGESLARYASAAGNVAVEQGRVSTNAEGEGEWTLRVNYPAWGRYLLRVCDADGGHCTGQVFYIDWPGWAGRAQEERGDGASRLTLYTDRARYEVGDVATVQLPPAGQGRALVSVENGSRMLAAYWLELAAEQTTFELPITAEMAPNVYVSVTLLQPHEGRDNDRPLRLFGIVPIMVEDPGTHLAPQLSLPEEVAPRVPFTVEVAERDGRPMTYTLAVVDEGLLGLTNFQTPNLHRFFYQREALGVRTWDLFDEVAGAYSGELERLLAIGGSDVAEEDDESRRKRRFPPVVKFLGAHRLEANATQTHEIELPQYLGAVRVMLVAGDQGRYGRAEQTVRVREALSLLPTLPRLVRPGERFIVPVHVFVTDERLGEVEVSLAGGEYFNVLDEPVQLSFDGAGEAIARLAIEVGDQVGTGTLRIEARAGATVAVEEVHLPVVSANPASVERVHAELAPGEVWSHAFLPHGLPGTNTASLELSAIPPLNLGERLDYLLRYPHGCGEQVASAAFPQLYLPALLKLGEDDRARVDTNVQAAIDRLRGYQNSDGGFPIGLAAGEPRLGQQLYRPFHA
ncbi:alpha-2-macroglobulin [Alkalilimnicola ehrlichii]|uniref:Alpha-2-macroglobulin domain protein n=1 Tax=Alkalilimnicola ehrlichii TaxID=351052 RepID=A0A3E0WR10_9GAMM|nr:MG2 domain-containing protein [Alkalilimnicola ehrlichii]RFA35402.1 hypothetical protein CAL65_13055 [Alkalilimnicola ehrlichii]